MIRRGHAGRTDDNHGAVRDALRAMGCHVTSLASVGDGCPDLLVGWRGHTVLMEVKDGSKVPSARKLTEDEATFHRNWPGGPCVVVLSPEEACLAMLGATGDAFSAFRPECGEVCGG